MELTIDYSNLARCDASLLTWYAAAAARTNQQLYVLLQPATLSDDDLRVVVLLLDRVGHAEAADELRVLLAERQGMEVLAR